MNNVTYSKKLSDLLYRLAFHHKTAYYVKIDTATEGFRLLRDICSDLGATIYYNDTVPVPSDEVLGMNSTSVFTIIKDIISIDRHHFLITDYHGNAILFPGSVENRVYNAIMRAWASKVGVRLKNKSSLATNLKAAFNIQRIDRNWNVGCPQQNLPIVIARFYSLEEANLYITSYMAQQASKIQYILQVVDSTGFVIRRDYCNGYDVRVDEA